MIFNEYAALCKNNGTNFNNVRELMLKKMDKSYVAIVPGTDGSGVWWCLFSKRHISIKRI